MNAIDRDNIATFLAKWQGSEGNERANYQSFFGDLCRAIGVEEPPPKGSVAGDPYCFDKDIKFFEDSEKTRFADFYKEGCFLIEAKQGSDSSSKGHGKRSTKTYRDNLQKAFNQAKSYAYNRLLGALPPFLMVCDIGSHFEIWEGFSGEYGSYGARQRVNLADLAQPEIFDRFVHIFTDPQVLNPERLRARVTREVAAELAKLSRWLEDSGHDPQVTASFLMRCIFTMFAEDVELLKGEVFTTALRDRWIPNPAIFVSEIEALWQTMNTGGSFGFERILKFNGSFFEDAIAIALPREQLEILYAAAAKDWSLVEPAIFGTLLERALEKRERSRLGAHYTPRSYVERLVRPVVMEPLRSEWEKVDLQVKALLKPEDELAEPTATERRKAEEAIRAFWERLRSVKILDPACGTGNFLYVSLDLLKGLELEVVTRLVDVVGDVQLNVLEQVNPSQFLGIELNPRAAAIAELVIWIGYLQWFFKRYGNAEPPEPVLQAFGNIECRDAVLAYDEKVPDVDGKTGVVRTRWGGRMMVHPVTGESVPDPSDQVVIYKYLNPRPAEWPEADYIVSNPPFIGNKRMRGVLGDGYVETLRKIQNDVPEPSDFVMYWWNQAGQATRDGRTKRFGFITTNSITNSFNKKVLEKHLSAKKPIFLCFAIPDHPWIDSSECAAVRVSMTVVSLEQSIGKLLTIENEVYLDDGISSPIFSIKQGVIHSNLSIGADVGSMKPLKSNYRMAFQGVIPLGSGFRLEKENIDSFGLNINDLPEIIKEYMIGRDLVQEHKQKWIIDFYGLTKEEACFNFPSLYQRVLELVKPSRDQNNRKSRQKNWWLFGENAPKLRSALLNLDKFIVTPDTSKFKPFIFIDSKVLPDVQLYSIVSNDAWILGILESSVHQSWLFQVAPRMGKGNDLRWKPAIVFDPFPFPDPTEKQKQKIRDLGEQLDRHRKQVQQNHPDITITSMYNLLEKLRAGEPFTDKDRDYNDRALVSILKHIHDQLDTAVLDAYGWPHTITDEQILENLVNLNTQRAEEERNGLIRWLRPEYQNPDQTQQTAIKGIAIAETEIPAAAEQQKWPIDPVDRCIAIHDLLRNTPTTWTIPQIAAQFKGKNTQKKLNAIDESLKLLDWKGWVLPDDRDGEIHWRSTEIFSS
jgi:hypothetical protein